MSIKENNGSPLPADIKSFLCSLSVLFYFYRIVVHNREYGISAYMHIIFFDNYRSKRTTLWAFHFHFRSVLAFTKTTTTLRTHCILHIATNLLSPTITNNLDLCNHLRTVGRVQCNSNTSFVITTTYISTRFGAKRGNIVYSYILIQPTKTPCISHSFTIMSFIVEFSGCRIIFPFLL